MEQMFTSFEVLENLNKLTISTNLVKFRGETIDFYNEKDARFSNDHITSYFELETNNVTNRPEIISAKPVDNINYSIFQKIQNPDFTAQHIYDFLKILNSLFIIFFKKNLKEYYYSRFNK